jgi:hypothetical protein
MEEIESPVEHLSEELHHAAEHGKESWLRMAALLSALLAVLAATAGMQSGYEANQAMVEQIRSSDAWSYYQAKGIKEMIEESLPRTPDTMAKMQKYKDDQKTIQTDAEAKVTAAEQHLNAHEILSRAVTLFQVAIAITAIAVLARQRKFLFVAGGLGVCGAAFFVQYWLM